MSGPASPSASPPAAATSSSPFSPSSFLSSKIADAKLAVSSLSVDSATASLEGLASPVKAQVDAALSRANAELRAKMAQVEEELRARAAKMDAEFAQAKTELSASFDRQRAELEARADEKLGSMKESMRAELEAKKAEFEAKKLALHSRALQEFEGMLMGLMDKKVLPAVQDAAIDPLMPQWVQRLVRGAIASTWPDVKEEVLDVWQGATLSFVPVELGERPPACPNFIRALRASWVYHTYPFDRNIWWQLRRPMWWLFLCISLFPLWGAQAAYFILLFLALDKGDEFQLVNFILQFKGMQFVTLGIINCVVGAGSYFSCVTRSFVGDSYVVPFLKDPADGSQLYIHDCDRAGPGALPGFYTDLILFLAQSLTIWIAMALLPSSEKKGLRTVVAGSPPRRFPPAEQTAEGEGAASKKAKTYQGMGGKLRQMIFLDAFILLVVIGLAVLLLFIRPYDIRVTGAFTKHEWLFKSDMFWLKTLYGLASFPWLIFLVPGLSQLLMHLRPTGYNRSGECVPFVLRKNDDVARELQAAAGAGATVAPAADGAARQRVAPEGARNSSHQVASRDGVPAVVSAWGESAPSTDHVVVVHPAV